MGIAVILLNRLDHLYKFSIPLCQKAPHEVWRKSAEEKLFKGVDGRTDEQMDDRQGTTDDGLGMITIAHPAPLALVS